VGVLLIAGNDHRLMGTITIRNTAVHCVAEGMKNTTTKACDYSQA